MLVIPVYNHIILPNSDIYFQTEHVSGNLSLLGKLGSQGPDSSPAENEEKDREKLTSEDFYLIGVSVLSMRSARRGMSGSAPTAA